MKEKAQYTEAFRKQALEDIIMNSSGGIFHNAAQVWNHTLYWNCLSVNGGGEPSGALAEPVNSAFGTFDAFKEAFSKSAATNFGSGVPASACFRIARI